MSISKVPSKSTDGINLKAQSRLYSAKIELQPLDKGTIVTVNYTPRAFFNIVLHVLMFSALAVSVFYIKELVVKISPEPFLIGISVAIFTIIMFLWKDNSLQPKLAKHENVLWEFLHNSFDMELLLRPDGSVYPSIRAKLLSECFQVFMLLLIGYIACGFFGLAILSIICIPVAIMILAEQQKKLNPHWNWRFWVIANMGQWHFLLLAFLAIIPLFFTFEVLLPQKLYMQQTPASFTELSTRGYFRRTDELRQKTRESFYEGADYCIKNIKYATDAERNLDRRIMLFIISVFNFIIWLIFFVFFIIRPTRRLLNNHKIWQNEVVGQEVQQGPAVPYMPDAWKWKTPTGFRALIWLHYFWGGIINWLVCIFSIDGISYFLTGKALVIPQSANLWSWLLASNEILFGYTTGCIVSGAFILIFSSITLMTLGTFLKRIFKSCLLTLSLLRHYPNPKLNSLDEFITAICKQYKIRKPAIHLTSKSQAVIRLKYLPLLAKPVIEISTGTLNLLEPNELNAVVAHEIGHIRQGLFKIELLKILSSLAMFPNYYLTLILDWPAKEIDADKFAIEATHNENAIKNALVKIFAAQISYTTASENNASQSKSRWHSMLVSIQFYWGENLFGYSHPYLSERLAVMEKPAT